jgi:thiamine-phosphate pyrophosphorylase
MPDSSYLGAERRRRLGTAKLYLVCDTTPGAGELAQTLRGAIAGGVEVVQLREKRLSDDELVAFAHAARVLCERLGALLIVNDRPTVALQAGADGVHVGQGDMPVSQVRELVGEDLLIGLSTHAPAEIQSAGSEDGPGRPDYIGVGPVHATPTKAGRPAVGLDLVRFAAAHSRVPFFAIGGIDGQNVGEVVSAGGSRVAVLRAISDAEDPERAAKRLAHALDGARAPHPDP